MGKKLESNFTNMVVVLFSVTLIASAAVGYVYSLTAGPIEAAKQAKQVNAIREVIPGEFDNDPNADVWKSQTADGGELEFYPAKEKRRTDRNSSKNLYQQRIRRKNMVNGRIQSGW